MKYLKPNNFFTWIFFVLLNIPIARADWLLISTRHIDNLEHYIDLESTKQSGPMAIYRQVRELIQSDSEKIPGSKTYLIEYDCMNFKARQLELGSFTQKWASGEQRVVSLEPAEKAWISANLLRDGLVVLEKICPGLNTN